MTIQQLVKNLFDNPGQVFALVGSLMIAAGLLKALLGFNIPLPIGPLEFAVAGWLTKNI